MQFFINHIVNRNLLKSGFTSTVSRYSIIRDWQNGLILSDLPKAGSKAENTGTDGLENYLKKLICQRKKAQVFPKYYVNLRKKVLLDRNLIWMMTEHI